MLYNVLIKINLYLTFLDSDRFFDSSGGLPVFNLGLVPSNAVSSLKVVKSCTVVLIPPF